MYCIFAFGSYFFIIRNVLRRLSISSLQTTVDVPLRASDEPPSTVDNWTSSIRFLVTNDIVYYKTIKGAAYDNQIAKKKLNQHFTDVRLLDQKPLWSLQLYDSHSEWSRDVGSIQGSLFFSSRNFFFVLSPANYKIII